jgi:hypothetical protein
MSHPRIGAAFLIVVLALGLSPAPAASSTTASDRLGRVWYVTEDGNWTGTWSRRGDSTLFDAVWYRGNERVTGVLTMSVQGAAVRIQSRQQTNGSDVDYEGTLSADGKSIRGTLRVLGRSGDSGWKAAIDPEQARIPYGRIWSVSEEGGWQGTWTRRGDSQIFDAVWYRGNERVTGVLTMTFRESLVSIRSRQQTNGHDVDYEGKISTDGKYVGGSLFVIGDTKKTTWKATIEEP